MLTLTLRCVLIYLIVLVVFRLMGKRQLGELQPFEFVITLMIADIATIPMTEINVPLLHGAIPVITLSLLHFLISFLSRKSICLRKLLNGKPVIVINPNGIDYEALKKLNMSFNDLCEALRELNFFSPADVQYAIIETNGKMTAIPTADNTPLTAKDMSIKTEATLPLMLICDGKIMAENMKIAKLAKDDLSQYLKVAGNYKTKDIVFATIDNAGKMYIQPKDQKFVVKNVDFEGGDNW